MFNDSGTYFIKNLAPIYPPNELSPQTLIERARLAKVQVRNERIDTNLWQEIGSSKRHPRPRESSGIQVSIDRSMQ